MGEYVAYPAYKPSEVTWLGEVPQHWQIIRIKHLTPVKRGASPRPIDDPKYFDDEGEFAWVRIADVSASDRYLKSTSQRLSEIGQNLSVKRWPDDLFLSIAGTVGKPIITKIKCCIHDGFVYFPDFEHNNEFLYYIFACGRPYLGLGKMGTQLNLNTDTVGSILIGLPPKEEQEDIVSFLDFKTAQIDALIAKKKALLDKLAEKRTALISHAVTKGLDPFVPMKDSGVQWLGEIPAHWDIDQFSHFIFFQEGPGIMAADFHESGVPLLRIHNVQSEVVNLDGCNYLDPEKVKIKWDHFRLNAGDLLISCSASTGLVSEVDQNSEGAIAYTGIIRLKAARDEICKEFIKILVGSSLFFEQIAVLKTGTTLQHFGPAHLRRMFITLPPVNEQLAITEHINRACGKIVRQNEKVQSAIERLQEYRSALITNTVTGKIDVRDFVVPKPAKGAAV